MLDNFAQLQQAFLSGLPNRLERINELTASCIDHGDAFQAHNMELLHRELHKLSGAAACYQCHDLHNAAQACESWLETRITHDTPLAEHTSFQFLEKLENLKKMCVAASA
ncbi:Hpt domain-containing protein [Marinobacterium sp. MBR-109]|uniref:Hpt domain-containing protein n=1 Tax=Marinobacterium sp. MBR-109 TaxID=3156462 RepID=UPI003399D884